MWAPVAQLAGRARSVLASLAWRAAASSSSAQPKLKRIPSSFYPVSEAVPLFEQELKSRLHVDQSRALREILRSPHHRIVLERPEGFGKQTLLSTLSAFVDRTTSDEVFERLFGDLEIYKDEEIMSQHARKYIVLQALPTPGPRRYRYQYNDEHELAVKCKQTLGDAARAGTKVYVLKGDSRFPPAEEKVDEDPSDPSNPRVLCCKSILSPAIAESNLKDVSADYNFRNVLGFTVDTVSREVDRLIRCNYPRLVHDPRVVDALVSFMKSTMGGYWFPSRARAESDECLLHPLQCVHFFRLLSRAKYPIEDLLEKAATLSQAPAQMVHDPLVRHAVFGCKEITRGIQAEACAVLTSATEQKRPYPDRMLMEDVTIAHSESKAGRCTSMSYLRHRGVGQLQENGSFGFVNQAWRMYAAKHVLEHSVKSAVQIGLKNKGGVLKVAIDFSSAVLAGKALFGVTGLESIKRILEEGLAPTSSLKIVAAKLHAGDDDDERLEMHIAGAGENNREHTMLLVWRHISTATGLDASQQVGEAGKLLPSLEDWRSSDHDSLKELLATEPIVPKEPKPRWYADVHRPIVLTVTSFSSGHVHIVKGRQAMRYPIISYPAHKVSGMEVIQSLSSKVLRLILYEACIEENSRDHVRLTELVYMTRRLR